MNALPKRNRTTQPEVGRPTGVHVHSAAQIHHKFAPQRPTHGHNRHSHTDTHVLLDI